MGLRDEMPTVSAYVDAMREAFGVDEVNGWLLGRNGGAFWAAEDGPSGPREWGERPVLGAQAMSLAAYRRLGEPLLPAPKPEP